MHIAELRVRNIKRISAVAIAPDSGEPIILTGDNGQGKSSVLDAILLALQNRGLEDPVRHGASKGSITLRLVETGGEVEYTVERVVTAKNTSLRITAKDGEVRSPQAFLNSLLGNLAFDPLEFMRMKPQAQAASLRALLGVDTSALDTEYAQVFAQRTEVNRALGEAQAQLKAMVLPEIPPESTESEMSVAELVAEAEAIDAVWRAFHSAESKSEDALRVHDEHKRRVAKLREELSRAELELEKMTQSVDELASVTDEARAKAEKAGDVRVVRDRIANVESVNSEIRAARTSRQRALDAADRYNAKKASVQEAQERADELTESLEAITEKRLAMTRAVTMPYPGMTFDDAGVFIEGVRLDQMSTAEQVRISTCVAMRGNPKLRLILIREGALLNRAHLKAVVDAAREADYQIFIERFQEEPGDVGLHIEDGTVSHVDGKKVEKKAPKSTEPAQPKSSDSLL